jgi:hypothetical protein
VAELSSVDLVPGDPVDDGVSDEDKPAGLLCQHCRMLLVPEVDETNEATAEFFTQHESHGPVAVVVEQADGSYKVTNFLTRPN